MFEKLVLAFGCTKCETCDKYSPAGRTYRIDNENYIGNYWYYEGEGFFIDIHDILVRREVVVTEIPDVRNYFRLSSAYLVSANGEWLYPYENMTSHSMFFYDSAREEVRYSLHGNFPYIAVGVRFKESFLKDYVTDLYQISEDKLPLLFYETKDLVTAPMSKIAEEIISCKMDSPTADVFFEAKAKEWIAITMNAYSESLKKPRLSPSDEASLKTVERYINDHYPMEIRQEFLERIAGMSGTNLKTKFKEKHGMNLTEYIQRKRINGGEHLLLTTDLNIKDIAEAVGYSSHSRFSQLYKRYKHINPVEVRALQREARKKI